MSVSAPKRFLSWLVIIATPLTLRAGDQAAATISSRGTVLVNGNALPDASAIQSGATIQTQPDSVANITATGTSIIVQPSSILTFAESSITLQQGSVSVASSHAVATSAGTVTATPANSSWSEYEMSISNGMVDVVARKANLAVNCGKEVVTLKEGMSVTSDPSGKCKTKKSSGAYPPASGDILSSPYLKYVAAAAGGGVLIWLLWPTPQQPASASQP